MLGAYGVIPGQSCLAVGTREVHRPRVTGRHVTVGIVGGNGESLRRAGSKLVGKPLTLSEAAAADWTMMLSSLPMMASGESVAVMVWVPVVLNVN